MRRYPVERYDRQNHKIIFYSADTVFQLVILDHNLVRLNGFKNKPAQSRTWSIVSDDNTCPIDGVDKDDVSRYPCPDFVVRANKKALHIHTDVLSLSIDLQDFAIRWQDKQGRILMADVPGLSYVFKTDSTVAHYLQTDRTDCFYGFGEVSGPLNKRHKRIRLKNRDAFGYNAETGMPLYKHIPFYITLKNNGAAYGLFYDNLHETVFDLGCEIDAYYGFYRYWQAAGGDLDLYFMFGDSIAHIVRTFTRLTGRPPIPPYWTLGYLASGMKYTDSSNIADQLHIFAENCHCYCIPCSGFHLSSGYTASANGRRYVFHWNQEQSVQPRTLIAAMNNAGMEVIANVKPALLTDHSLYSYARDRSFFITSSQQPALSMFWGGEASFIDFTNPDSYSWWKAQLRDHLISCGIQGIWNDNNEFDVHVPTATCHGFGQSVPLTGMESTQSLLMARAAYEALLETNPNRRPFVISRSGGPGLQRYAQTWSGDNISDWTSYQFNIPMGLGLSLCGISNTGHDVGGYFGLQPTLDLWMRWLQTGIFWPRFCIHSYHQDDSVNEPWIYPEMIAQVRELIRLRYHLMPYLYSLFWHATTEGAPIVRPLIYAYQDDPVCRDISFTFLQGPFLLVTAVTEPNVDYSEFYLPGEGWYNWYHHTLYDGHRYHRLHVPLHEAPLYVAEGGIVPAGEPSRRIIYLFPHRQEGNSEFTMYEDDGQTLEYQRGNYTLLRLQLHCTPKKLYLNIIPLVQGYQPSYREIILLLPMQEQRPLETNCKVLSRIHTSTRRGYLLLNPLC